MLAFLPHGTDQCRVNELRASARSRHELEALAVQKYEHDVLAYRVYARMPHYDLDSITRLPERRQARLARRSMI